MVLPKKIAISKKAVYAIIIMVVCIAAYLIFSNFIVGKIEIIKPIQVEVKVLVVPKIQSGFDDQFLTQAPYNNLRQNGQLPVTVSQLGKSNPFGNSPVVTP